jgi:ribonucleotide monophosphatase NagD (HAD superfamily)
MTLAGPGVDRARVLAVGDGLHTDLAGAKAHGFDALFVADGVHATEALDPSGGIDEVALHHLLAGADAAFAIKSLLW